MSNRIMSSEYIKGVDDCMKGVPATEYATDEYICGYGEQYAAEQCASQQPVSTSTGVDDYE